MNELWQQQNALMSTILSADWLYDWLPACNNGYPLINKKSTGGVRLAYSGISLLSTPFFTICASFLNHVVVLISVNT